MEDRADTAWSTFLFGTLWVLFVILIKWKRYAIKTTILFHSFETQLQWQNKHEEENTCENCSSAFLFGKHNLLVHKTKNHKAYLNFQCKIIWHNVNVWLKVSSSRFSKKTRSNQQILLFLLQEIKIVVGMASGLAILMREYRFTTELKRCKCTLWHFCLFPLNIYLPKKTGSWVVTLWVFPVKFSSMTWVLHK